MPGDVVFACSPGLCVPVQAVGVYPVGRAPEDGFVADSWIKQEPRFWTWKEWYELVLYRSGCDAVLSACV